MTLELRERERFKEGRAEGRAEGRVATMYEFVQKGIIQIEDVAVELNISPTEVENDMKKRGYKIPMQCAAKGSEV